MSAREGLAGRQAAAGRFPKATAAPADEEGGAGASGWVLQAAVGLSLSALFVMLRYGLGGVLGSEAPLMSLLAAPMLASWRAGLGAGVVATFACAVAGEILLAQPLKAGGAVHAAEWLRLVMFLFYGVASSWIVHARSKAIGALSTERERLGAAERRARETLEAAPSGMLLLDGQGLVQKANERAARLFGFAPSELEGMKLDELVPGAGSALSWEGAASAAVRGRPMGDDGELFARGKNGALFPVQMGLNPLQGESKGLVLASVLDVRQRREAESALREANRRKDDFIAVLAHELRNPLGPVRNAVEILKRAGPSEPALERARAVIDRQVDHMARLIDDLLDVSRISRGKLALKTRRCDFAAISRQVAEDYRSSVEGAGLGMVVTIRSEPIWVDGDPVRLAQMMGNLLSNAARFGREGGLVEVEVAEFEGRLARAAVRDEGVGLSPEMIERVFQPFEQGEQDIARSKGGLGLGLALTRGLAELHGGAVRVASAGLGLGSEFVIEMPLAQMDIAEGQPPATAARAQQEVSVPAGVGHALRVLVVEDNQDAASSFAELLRILGHHAKARHDAQSGLAEARAWRPHVVISDLGLPGGMDGYGLARALRADPSFSGLAIVAVSGYADEAARAQTRSAGFDAHLAKPVDIAELERLLSRMAAARESAYVARKLSSD